MKSAVSCSTKPEGTLRSTYSQDNVKIKLRYEDGYYYVESAWQYFGKTPVLEIAIVMFEASTCYGIDRMYAACIWAKHEYKRARPLTSIRGMEWETEAARQNHIIANVHNRMDGLRPVQKGKVQHWIQ